MRITITIEDGQVSVARPGQEEERTAADQPAATGGTGEVASLAESGAGAGTAGAISGGQAPGERSAQQAGGTGEIHQAGAWRPEPGAPGFQTATAGWPERPAAGPTLDGAESDLSAGAAPGAGHPETIVISEEIE